MLDGGFRLIGRLPFPYYRLFLIILAILLVLLSFYVIFKTSFGLKVRAVRRNRAISGCLGIDTARVDMMIFVFGSGLAGIAGAVLAPIKSVSPDHGLPLCGRLLHGLVLGGVGNLLGVPVGAGIIGEAETILAFNFNSVIGKLLVFVFIVMAIRVVPERNFWLLRAAVTFDVAGMIALTAKRGRRNDRGAPGQNRADTTRAADPAVGVDSRRSRRRRDRKLSRTMAAPTVRGVAARQVSLLSPSSPSASI